MTKQQYLDALRQAARTIVESESVECLHLVILYKDGKVKSDELAVFTAYNTNDKASGTLAEVLHESFLFFDHCWEETSTVN